MDLRDVQFEYLKGTGPGGQHKNKTETAVRATHIPTNTVVFIQEQRSRAQNKKRAIAVLKSRLKERRAEEKAYAKKLRRDEKIKERNIVRTYDFSRGVVKDHRSGKEASLKKVLTKGRIDLLRPT